MAPKRRAFFWDVLRELMSALSFQRLVFAATRPRYEVLLRGPAT